MSSYKVLITGIHTGLGYALAKQCLEAGQQVFGISRQQPEDLAENPLLQFTALNLRHFEEIPHALNMLLHDIEELDLVLLNAGVLGEIKDLKDTSLADLKAVMDINVWANKVLIDDLFRQHKKIKQVVAISSGAAFNGSGGWGAYSISKSALNLLIRVYAHEHPQTHFTSLAPGIIDTDMIKYIFSQPTDPRYPANTRINEALLEARIKTPHSAAAKLLKHIPDLVNHISGSFIDIRKL
ncbi:SDR family NAD(P)-dependent oxidoreductase [candidate division CSSED10-310 bacterium]|uniref:SDR family NAD(P)-dependent oxidoreductase n=1 Tax=candidate division CSSED10-310 bacterium TaxID=2855610 RepID=A0ABV6Z5E6_UNCC1